jgi:hypothetical protein
MADRSGAGRVAVEVDRGGRDRVLDELDALKSTREELHHFIDAVARAGADVVDDGIFGVDRSVRVPVAVVDRVVITDEQLLNLKAIGDLLLGERHFLAPFGLVARTAVSIASGDMTSEVEGVLTVRARPHHGDVARAT